MYNERVEENSPPSFLPLGELTCVREWFPGEFQQWQPSFGCRPEFEELVWLFRLSDPRVSSGVGGLDSVRQRLALLDTQIPFCSFLVDGSGMQAPEPFLVSEVVDGEPLAGFLQREVTLGEKQCLELLLSLVSSLRRLAVNSRVLSSFELNDFFVARPNGGRLEVVAVPVFALLREENPKSDFQLAKKWYEVVARLVAGMKSGWAKGISQLKPTQTKSMRKLLRGLTEGPEKSLTVRFEELESAVAFEVDSLSTRFLKASEGNVSVHPKGFLREKMIVGLDQAFDENGYAVDHERESLSCYSFPLIQKLNGERRRGFVVPPESWFDRSLLTAVNRKMSHPFLKNHHNGIRAFSVFCEETRTYLIAEGGQGIPLPLLISTRSGLESGEVAAIADKLDRALQQFEGAELTVELESPWQIELHFENVENAASLRMLSQQPLSKWPSWDVKLRVELPSEHFLGSRRTDSWRSLRSKEDVVFFSLLLAWMLEWKRFDWAMRHGRQETEPLSWDKELEKVYQNFGASAEGRRRLIEKVLQLDFAQV